MLLNFVPLDKAFKIIVKYADHGVYTLAPSHFMSCYRSIARCRFLFSSDFPEMNAYEPFAFLQKHKKKLITGEIHVHLVLFLFLPTPVNAFDGMA